MRKLALAAILTLGSAALAETVTHDPVQIPAIGFEAAIHDGIVILTWRRYKRDDFQSYEVLKSATNGAPMCPQDPTIYSTRDKDTLKYEDGKLAPGLWHYRLCILTRFGDRWVSPVVNVTIDPKDLKRQPPTDADFELPTR